MNLTYATVERNFSSALLAIQTPQGHIDIVAPAPSQLDCGTSCYWSAKETGSGRLISRATCGSRT